MKLKASFLAFLTAATILFSVHVFAKIEQQQYQEKVRAEVLGQLRASQARLEGELNSIRFLEKGLTAFILTHLAIDPQHRITQDEVNQFGAEFMPQQGRIKNFTLIQNNKITHVYPLAGHEMTVGTDLSQIPEQSRVLQKVIDKRGTMIAGPVNLVEGGVGLISRTAIYWTPKGGAEANYWGQVSLALSQDTLLSAAGLYEQSGMLKFALRGHDGLGKDGQVFWGDETVFVANPVIVNVKIGNGFWQLAAVPMEGWERNSPAFIWIWLIGIFIALCSGALVWSLIYSKEVQASLQWSKEDLLESEEKFHQMFTKQDTIMYLVDPDTLHILDANEVAQRFYGYSLETFKNMKVTDLNILSSIEVKNILNDTLKQKGGQWEFKHRLANGEIRDVEAHFTLIELKTKKFLFTIVYDISERKKTEERLRYIIFHDSLTELYARSYFEEEMRRLEVRRSGSVGLVVCDLDGLKLVNDTLGHESGDQMLINAAQILRNCFRENDVVARVGGDEFVVIMEGITREHMEDVCERLKNGIRMNNEEKQGVPVSLSIGFAISTSPSLSMRELFKEADNNMYREKLHRGQKARSAILQTVVDLLSTRDFIIDGHGDRLQEMVSNLGRTVGLSEKKISEIQLLAQFHDIGKVGISESTLMKEEPLTPEEFMEIRRHCEIGQRIALSTPDLTPIADWILKHQEWWDGTGYPLGIAGEEIPLECRILGIADAYDAMTNDRPYRKAMEPEMAIAELKRCAGTQFDPRLVEKFCEMLDTVDKTPQWNN